VELLARSAPATGAVADFYPDVIGALSRLDEHVAALESMGSSPG
jgi:hypothetical protein